VAEADRARWDARYARLGPPRVDAVGPPTWLAPHTDLLPTAGHALDLACGAGSGAVWLAARGLDVQGLDVSAVAVEQARDLARRAGVAERCRIDRVDLDAGLPEGPPVAVVLCHRFRDPRLDAAIVARLAPGGLLAIAACSEVGAGPGRFRVPPGGLVAAFATLEVITAGERDGEAWLLARA
jgi:SAM-dependent methyltransferase